MGDVVWGFDFKNKKAFKPEQKPVTDQLAIIAKGLSLDVPPEVLLAIYDAGGLVYVAPDQEPA